MKNFLQGGDCMRERKKNILLNTEIIGGVNLLALSESQQKHFYITLLARMISLYKQNKE